MFKVQTSNQYLVALHVAFVVLYTSQGLHSKPTPHELDVRFRVLFVFSKVFAKCNLNMACLWGSLVGYDNLICLGIYDRVMLGIIQIFNSIHDREVHANHKTSNEGVGRWNKTYSWTHSTYYFCFSLTWLFKTLNLLYLNRRSPSTQHQQNTIGQSYQLPRPSPHDRSQELKTSPFIDPRN